MRNGTESNPFQKGRGLQPGQYAVGRGLQPGQYAVVLVKDAWKKLADFLDREDLPEDIRIIRVHVLIQTGLVDEEGL